MNVQQIERLSLDNVGAVSDAPSVRVAGRRVSRRLDVAGKHVVIAHRLAVLRAGPRVRDRSRLPHAHGSNSTFTPAPVSVIDASARSPSRSPPPRPSTSELPRFNYLVTMDSGFRWLYLPSLSRFDVTCPNTLHFYGLPVLAGPVRDVPQPGPPTTAHFGLVGWNSRATRSCEGLLPRSGKCKRTKGLK
jgi:hypothetical protein